jgi:hypothetical protein
LDQVWEWKLFDIPASNKSNQTAESEVSAISTKRWNISTTRHSSPWKTNRLIWNWNSTFLVCPDRSPELFDLHRQIFSDMYSISSCIEFCQSSFSPKHPMLFRNESWPHEYLILSFVMLDRYRSPINFVGIFTAISKN